MVKAPYKVLVVDDSSIIRQAIIAILNSSNDLNVVGEAANGHEALIQIPKLKPDIITLDIVMPEMDGLTALKHIMIFYPTPTVILSSFIQEGTPITFDAIRYGAIDFINKPSNLANSASRLQKEQLIKKVCLAAKVRSNALQYIRLKPNIKVTSTQKQGCKNLVVLGVGEGGYGTLLKIVPKLLVNNTTAYIIIFYEAAAHVDGFIRYLNHFSTVNVQRAVNNALLEVGGCYISTGEEYVTVHGERGKLTTYVSPAPFSSRRGSIDMLMFSVAENLDKHSLGVILSGAGSDGAEGLEEIVRVGGGAIIQSPVSCLYKSMALSALNLCEAEVVVADREIATEINNFLMYSVD
ncbi:MAG: chemotaxis protein CheB [Methylococcales bacterium]|nr:chemotaxis protein CheB [Methylococcales bacterium]